MSSLSFFLTFFFIIISLYFYHKCVSSLNTVNTVIRAHPPKKSTLYFFWTALTPPPTPPPSCWFGHVLGFFFRPHLKYAKVPQKFRIWVRPPPLFSVKNVFKKVFKNELVICLELATPLFPWKCPKLKEKNLKKS